MLAVLSRVLILGTPVAVFAVALTAVVGPEMLASPFFVAMLGAFAVLFWLRFARLGYAARARWFVAACAATSLSAVGLFGFVTAPVLGCLMATIVAAVFLGVKGLAATLVAVTVGIALVGLGSSIGDTAIVGMPVRRFDYWQWCRAAGEFLFVGGSAGALVLYMTRRIEQQERAFNAAQRLEALGKLAGGVAHDFNNSLQVIRIWIELLRAPSAEGKLEQALAEIESAVSRATGLTRQLLAVGRRDLIELQRTDLSERIGALANSIARTIPEDIELRATIEPTPMVECDVVQIEQVLLNLIINARDALHGGGTIDLRIEPAARADIPDIALLDLADTAANEFVCLTVADNGPGMTEEVRKRAFEPFFTTKEEQGTGLGLSIVYGAVRKHGGAITIDSQPGQGCRFTIWLPAAGPSASYDDRGEPDSPAKSRRTGEDRPLRILLAEDEPGIRRSLCRALEVAGLEVLAVADGDQAIASIESEPSIDVLCTDGVMPGAPTQLVIERFLERHPGGCVLVCSGHVEEELSRRELADAGHEFLQKPFAPKALVARIERLVERERRRESSL